MSGTRQRLKDWLLDEAARAGRSVSAINNRLRRGQYPALRLERVNARVVFIVRRPQICAENHRPD